MNRLRTRFRAPLNTIAILLVALLRIAGVPDTVGARCPDRCQPDDVTHAATGVGGIALVTAPSGGSILLWTDAHPHLFARRFDRFDDPVWPSAVQVKSDNPREEEFSATADGTGGAIAAFLERTGGAGSPRQLMAQRFDSLGTRLWTNSAQLVSTTVRTATTPAVTSDGLQGAIVFWIDQRVSASQDIYVQRLNAAGSLQWTVSGVPICVGRAGNRTGLRAIPDGSGGAIVVWQDSTLGTSPLTQSKLYAQRVDAQGAVLWTTNGARVCPGSSLQFEPTIAPDGVGGVVIVWSDGGTGNVSTQRLAANGVGAWNCATPLCAAAGVQDQPALARTGASSWIACWRDGRSEASTGKDIYAQRLDLSGGRAWTGDGVALCTVARDQNIPAIAADAALGVLVTWEDRRTGGEGIYGTRVSPAGATLWLANGTWLVRNGGTTYSNLSVASSLAGFALVAQQGGDGFVRAVDEFGELGQPNPCLKPIADVSNDQGGLVRLQWEPACYDREYPAFPLGSYRVWRSDQRATVLDTTQAILVATVPPTGSSLYTATVPAGATLFAGQPPPYRTYFVEMPMPSLGVRHVSFADSAYAIDNLNPATPTGLTAYLSQGATHLSWNANPESDVTAYRVYRGTTIDFVPSAATLIATVTSPAYIDPDLGAFYRVAALDANGNGSGTVLLDQCQIPPASAELPSDEAALIAQGGPTSVSLPFEAATGGPVTLTILDSQGRAVRRERLGARLAGAQEWSWNLLDSAGLRVPRGFYLVRISGLGWGSWRSVAVSGASAVESRTQD